ncbi:V-type proton ATPase subunit S1 isoform X3 [Electrophorus electricus]|uniref:V-type proton ATPase subunit S1 isoform X3 n=1 Tax=Electrophorus electricus TaxID=8005 RepID=UPI0015D00357|nr:V-type proton ATPase subunit S1 isoform X3 [Electrophorus electricus]
MASQRRPVSFAIFSFIFFQISSSYEQVNTTVEKSSNDPLSTDSRVSENGAAGKSQSALYGEMSSPFGAEEQIRPPLQAHEWEPESAPRSRRNLLQYAGIMPYSPLNVVYNGKTCILFRARKLAIRYRNHTLVDLTERAFGPDATVDTKGSFCSKDKATLNLRFGDVDDLRGLSISSLQKYDTLLVPSSNTDSSANWHITFTDFQIQAFNVQSNKFSVASDCGTFFTPAILMGLITSLILLLVLAYALHMVVHLKHIDRYEEHKTTVYFPRSTEADCTEKNNL